MSGISASLTSLMPGMIPSPDGVRRIEVFLLGDEILEVRKFSGDIAAVSVDQIIGEAELFGAVLETGLEVRVERHLR